MSTISSLLPHSFESWKHCITIKCKISLTPEYIEARIGELTDDSNPGTRQFKKMYGETHWQNVLGWFNQARCR